MNLSEYKKYRSSLKQAAPSMPGNELQQYKQYRANLNQPEQAPEPVQTSLRTVNDNMVTAPKVYPAVTNTDVQTRLKIEQDNHTKQLRALEQQYKNYTKGAGMHKESMGAPQIQQAIKVMEEKQKLLANPPTVESVRKKMLAEQGRQMIMDNPSNEDAWLQYVANTMSPVDLEKYQVNPTYQKMVKAANLPQWQAEQKHAQLVESTRRQLNQKMPLLGENNPLRTVLESFYANGVLGWQATGDTLAGVGMTTASDADRRGMMTKEEKTSHKAVQQASGAAALQKGAETYNTMAVRREARVGDNVVRGFLYDASGIVPDMVATIALAAATGGVGAEAKIAGQVTAKQLAKQFAEDGMKAVAKNLMKKDVQQEVLQTLGKKLLVSPETVPLGTKIFAQSYQNNLANGMGQDQAFFTAFINAYGQSLLEGGGVNKMVREGGVKKAAQFLKSAMGEGWEEVPQNWWEGVVNKYVGGQDIPWYSEDPNQNSVINPGRDLYSAATAMVGGGIAAAPAAGGAVKGFVQDKAMPNVEQTNLAEAFQRDSASLGKYQNEMADFMAKTEEYNSQMEKYKREMDAYNSNPDAPKYDQTEPTTTELKDAAESIIKRLVGFERAKLKAESTNAKTMEEWNSYQEKIDATTPKSVIESILQGTASPEVMDQVKALVYKGRTVAESMAKLKDVKINAPQAPAIEALTMPELPEFADLSPKVSTEKMLPSLKEGLQEQVKEAESLGVKNKIIEMASAGKTRKEIVDTLNVHPKMVRAVMSMEGIPDVKSKAFEQWKAVQDYSTWRKTQINQQPEAPTLPDTTQAKLDNIPALKGAKAAENLTIGEAHAQRLGKQLGVDVVFYDGGKDSPHRGVYSPENSNTIFINRDYATQGTITMEIMGHEFLHSVQANHSDLYKTLKEVVGDSMTAEKVQKQLEKYAADPAYQTKLAQDKELLIEEMLADEAGTVFTDKAFWESLYTKDETLAQKLIRIMRDFLNRILGEKSESKNLDVMTELQIKEFQKKFEDAVAEVMKRAEGQRVENVEGTSKTDNVKYSIPTIKIVMDETKAPVNVPDSMQGLYRRIVNRQQAISDADSKAGELAATANLVSGTIEHIFTNALVDTNGKKIGKSWAEVVQPFAKNEDFWMYMAQRHNIDRAREGKPVDPGMSPLDSAQHVSQAEKAHPEYKAWGDEVVSWIDKFMQTWGVGTGIIDAQTYQDWRTTYPSYFPTYREFSELEDGSNQFGPGKRFVDLPNPVKGATGSDRDMSNPVGGVMQMVNKVVRTARYNEVGKALLDSVQADPAKMKPFAEEIPANIGMFTRQKFDNVVTVWDSGSPHYLQINSKELLDSLMGLPKVINNAPKVRAVTNLYKGLITQYNPFFALRNIFRDIPTAYVYGSQDNPLFFLKNLVKAGYQIATDTDGASQFKALGGMGSGQFGSDTAAGLAKKLDPKQPALARYAKNGLEAIKWFNELTEMAPRVAEFNHVLQKTGDVQKALHAAENVTVDFSRGGDVTKQIEPFVPYINASVQGLDVFFRKMVTDFKKDPAKVAGRWAKAGIMVTAPQFASILASTFDDDNKKAYNELSRSVKDAYFLFPKGDGTFWKIPKSRELGVLFASLFERAFYEHTMKDFGSTVATNFTPVDPFTNNLAAPLVFNLPMNKDFAGRDIVPRALQDGRSPRYQYDDNTSSIAKAIGDKTNLSPKQIDYIIRSYSGIIGQIVQPLTTQRLGASGAVEKVITNSWTADPAYSNQHTTDFYNKLDELTKKAKDKNFTEKIPSKVQTNEEHMVSAMNKIASAATKASKYTNSIQHDDPRIKTVKEAVTKAMDKAVKAKTLADIYLAANELNSILYRLGVK